MSNLHIQELMRSQIETQNISKLQSLTGKDQTEAKNVTQQNSDIKPVQKNYNRTIEENVQEIYKKQSEDIMKQPD